MASVSLATLIIVGVNVLRKNVKFDQNHFPFNIFQFSIRENCSSFFDNDKS